MQCHLTGSSVLGNINLHINLSCENENKEGENPKQQWLLFFLKFLIIQSKKVDSVVMAFLKALIHYQTWSNDPISCYGKPVEWTNELEGDFTGLLHWFPIKTDWIIGRRPKMDWDLYYADYTPPIFPHKTFRFFAFEKMSISKSSSTAGQGRTGNIQL